MAKTVRVYDVRLQVTNSLGKATYKILYVGSNKKQAELECSEMLTKNLVENGVPKFNLTITKCVIIRSNAIIFERIRK